uniref:Nudix domain-containing protein n=1 Tax=Melanopsichium pennsylvanicum 4 TaxID=1398559 RepID=A0A077QWR6_9BASI|nr:nudix domain-containing protein [Melanopsichium pennsylvanicum 4]
MSNASIATVDHGKSNGKNDDLACLSALAPENATHIRRLLKLPPAPSFSHVPKRKQAAVAAILYESRACDSNASRELRVIMSTRALHLRSHPGQASLPGGKVDSTDETVVETALRESVEEIALPANEAIHLHTGYPFLSKMGVASTVSISIRSIGYLVNSTLSISQFRRT